MENSLFTRFACTSVKFIFDISFRLSFHSLLQGQMQLHII